LGTEAPGPAQGGQILDRVVAVVESQLITLTDLTFEARVFLVEQGGVEAVKAPLDDAILRGALEASIAQRLQVAEADRLQAYPLDEQALLRRVRAFEERVGGKRLLQEFLEQQDTELSRLEEVLGRAQRAEKILDSKIRLRARVSESDVRREFDQHKDRYGGSFDAVRGAIRERLTRERYGVLAKEELASVRAAANVRLVAPLARARPGNGSP
jgi:hypothetical protein